MHGKAWHLNKPIVEVIELPDNYSRTKRFQMLVLTESRGPGSCQRSPRGPIMESRESLDELAEIINDTVDNCIQSAKASEHTRLSSELLRTFEEICRDEATADD